MHNLLVPIEFRFVPKTGKKFLKIGWVCWRSAGIRFYGYGIVLLATGCIQPRMMPTKRQIVRHE
jgi:hypothetical protein